MDSCLHFMQVGRWQRDIFLLPSSKEDLARALNKISGVQFEESVYLCSLGKPRC